MKKLNTDRSYNTQTTRKKKTNVINIVDFEKHEKGVIPITLSHKIEFHVLISSSTTFLFSFFCGLCYL